MNNQLTRIAIAAGILLIAGLLIWPSNPGTEPQDFLSSLSLLTRAHAAERAVFSGKDIVYLVNTFTLIPVPEDTRFSYRLEALENALADDDLENAGKRNLEALRAWFSYHWLPFYSLGGDGGLKTLKAEPRGAAPGAMTERIWYDPASGRFVRTMETEGTVIFANSFDGRAVYTLLPDETGILRVRREATAADFVIPENPADFLGMGVGVTDAFSRQAGYPPILDVSEGISGQTPVRTYKMGFADFEGFAATYYLFKVGMADNIIHEIQCVVEHQPSMAAKRISTQNVSAADYSWDLNELDALKTPAGAAAVVIHFEIGQDNISVRAMVDTADYETYIFAAAPDWTLERQISSGPDEGSVTSLMFAVIYPAADGRHVILSQMPSLTRYHTGAIKKMEEVGHPWPRSYISANGCEMYRGDKDGEKWWTEFSIKASGFEPVENRCGVIIKTPCETFLALAVNGPVSDEALHRLVDSLIPARDYQGD